MSTSRRPITPEGFQRYQEELDQLWRVERPKVVNEVADAAALGDRSENAEYIYGKKKLREIDRRMGYLSRLLENLVVIDPARVKAQAIQFGATVVVADEDGDEKTYRIVGEDEVDAKNRQISGKSPLGKALLGKRVGDVVVVQRPAGDLEVEVLRVTYG